MIKFRIHPKISERERRIFAKVLKKYQHHRLFGIFWDILNKMKDNFGQECVKGRLLYFQGKIGTISSVIPGKITVFSSFEPTFLPVPP